MRIADGTAESHETPLPLDPSHSPGVVAATPRFPSGLEQGGVRDLTGERLSQLAASQAEIGAAQSYGQGADAGRRGRYAASMAPMGASAGDQMALPPVAEDATTPTNDFLYGQGDQPGK